MPAEKAEVGRILKTITVIGRNGKVLPEKVEIRNTLKDMRIMAVDAIQWTGEKGRFIANTGRGLTIQGVEEETVVVWLRAGKKQPILADLDAVVPSGKDELICRICFQGIRGGVRCPLKDGNVCYQHCEKCRYGYWTGDHYACRYRYKKGPALW